MIARSTMREGFSMLPRFIIAAKPMNDVIGLAGSRKFHADDSDKRRTAAR